MAFHMVTMNVQSKLNRALHKITPFLHESLHKGQAGKLGVIGGSEIYTGAPYFSGMAALRVGADLCTVITVPEAAMPIKCYSPDLMVAPLLPNKNMIQSAVNNLQNKGSSYYNTASSGLRTQDNSTLHNEWMSANERVSQTIAEEDARIEDAFNKLRPYLDRLHGLVIGPGLGRDEVTMAVTAKIITYARTRDMPVVIDADGLHILTLNNLLIHGYDRAILSPNAAEFRRLWQSVFPDEKDSLPPMSIEHSDDWEEVLDRNSVGGFLPGDFQAARPVRRLARALGGVTILQKGRIDLISNGTVAVYCSRNGAQRRCGGLGDILSGATGIFSLWAQQYHQDMNRLDQDNKASDCDNNSNTIGNNNTVDNDNNNKSRAFAGSTGLNRTHLDVPSKRSYDINPLEEIPMAKPVIHRAVSPASYRSGRRSSVYQGDAKDKELCDMNEDQIPPSILAAYGGCFLTRVCSEQCYADLGRSMLASDVLARLPEQMSKMFPNDPRDSGQGSRL